MILNNTRSQYDTGPPGLASTPPVRHAGGIMTDTSWFATEVLRRLSGVKRGREPGQFYARCPAHDDKHASLAIRAGDSMPLIYHCHAVPGCDQAAIRQALAALGVPEERLGQYGTPQYERRRQIRGTSSDRRELEAARRELAEARRELADLKGDIRALLAADLSPAMLRVRVLATVDDMDIPADRKSYVAFAMRGGVSQPRAYAAWKSDPLGQARSECVTRDHVVLTQPEENRQASQVDSSPGILGTRKALSEREPGNSRNEKTGEPDTADAIKTLSKSRLTGRRVA
jgi:hypothetical protein